jgi:hypothetical protein
MFLHLMSSGMRFNACLSDTNAELVTTYKVKILKLMLIIIGFLAGMFFVGVQLLQKYGYVSTVKSFGKRGMMEGYDRDSGNILTCVKLITSQGS